MFRVRGVLSTCSIPGSGSGFRVGCRVEGLGSSRKDYTIYNAGAFPCNRATPGMTSGTSVSLNFASRRSAEGPGSIPTPQCEAGLMLGILVSV